MFRFVVEDFMKQRLLIANTYMWLGNDVSRPNNAHRKYLVHKQQLGMS